jgi:putative SOS response-associated peptidase YedK
MCNLYEYEMTEEDMRLLMEHYRRIGRNWAEATKVYPNYEAPVIVERAGERVPETMRWGFPPPAFVKSKAPVTNVRNVSKGYWRPYLGRESRCVVPVTAFSEFDQAQKRPRWFKRPDGKPFFFAGIWRPWTGDRGTRAKPNVGDHLLYAFLTTEPNSVVAPIHQKAMPVLLLDKAAVEQWLTGSDAEALELQRPAPEDAVLLVA